MNSNRRSFEGCIARKKNQKYLSPSTTINSLDGFIGRFDVLVNLNLISRDHRVISWILLIFMLLISMRTSLDGADFETYSEFSFQIATAVG